MNGPSKDSGEYRFEVLEEWAKIPEGWSIEEVAGVAVDSDDLVYLFSRGDHPMMIFDREGNLRNSWGEDVLRSAHSVRIGPDGCVYCVDFGDHTVRKLTKDGDLMLTLGAKDGPSDTGAVGRDWSTIQRVAGPFNGPTDVAFGPDGELFVSDGYGNARVHKFSREGELLISFGEPGTQRGQFRLPHGVYASADRLYLADRENSRVQVFDFGGRYLSEWNDVRRPTSIHADPRSGALFVSELGFKEETMAQGGRNTSGWNDASRDARVTIRSGEGVILSQIGGSDGCAPGNFFAPHALCVDSRGDLYVGEVVASTRAPRGCHMIQKFLRR